MLLRLSWLLFGGVAFMPPLLCAAWRLRRTGTLSRLIAIPMIKHACALALPSVNLHACAGRVA